MNFASDGVTDRAVMIEPCGPDSKKLLRITSLRDGWRGMGYVVSVSF